MFAKSLETSQFCNTKDKSFKISNTDCVGVKLIL